MKTSVLGAINVLGMAKRCRAKVLQASTSEVYGDPQVHPQPESYRGSVNPIGPRACYDEGKRAAETLFMDYHRANGVNVRIVRIFNTYGPRMHPYDGRVISNFIRQALEGEDITDLRRRPADPFLLLSRRPGRGPDPHDERPRRFLRPGEPRQPGGIHDPRVGRHRAGTDGLAVEARRPSAAGRRPHAAAAGHYARPAAAGLAADDSLARRAGEDDRLVPLDRPFASTARRRRIIDLWSAGICSPLFIAAERLFGFNVASLA